MLFFGPVKTAQCQISEMSMLSMEMIHACPWECNWHLNHGQLFTVEKAWMHFYTKFKHNGLKRMLFVTKKHIFMQWNKPSCSCLKPFCILIVIFCRIVKSVHTEIQKHKMSPISLKGLTLLKCVYAEMFVVIVGNNGHLVVEEI